MSSSDEQTWNFEGRYTERMKGPLTQPKYCILEIPLNTSLFACLLSRGVENYFYQLHQSVVADFPLEVRACFKRLFKSCIFGDLGRTRWRPLRFSPLQLPIILLTSWHSCWKASCTPSQFSRAETS